MCTYACGTGNFLAPILERKLVIAEKRFGLIQRDFERNAVLAVSSIYGVELLIDNVEECRRRLYDVFDAGFYARLFRDHTTERCRGAIRFILERNIVCGDALTLRTVDDQPGPIVFSEWSMISGSMIKRRDFTFRGLLNHERVRETPLFSDLGEDVFIPTPEKEFAPVHFLDVANA